MKNETQNEIQQKKKRKRKDSKEPKRNEQPLKSNGNISLREDV